MISKWLALGWMVAASTAASGCMESADSDVREGSGEDMATAQQSVFVPPAYCDDDVIAAGLQARLYWPPGIGWCAGTVDAPLVVLVNANGRDYTDYDYLLAHLAKNGFIAASLARTSIDTDALPAFVTKAEDFIDYLRTSWVHHSHVDASRIGLIGHSLGGMAVRHLAQELAGDPDLQVKGVVTLAQNGNDDVFLDGTMTPAYLVMYGTADNQRPPVDSFGHFDRAGAQGSQLDPLNNPHVLSRAMKLVVGAEHYDFADPVGVQPLGNSVREATKGYVLSFLRFHLMGSDSAYGSLIQGGGVPKGSGVGEVVSQYRHGGRRRVIAHFEPDFIVGGGSQPLVLSTVAAAEVLPLGSDPAYAHDTRAMRLQPDASGQYVRWSLPAGDGSTSTFKFLSLRIGQTGGDPASDVFVRVLSAGNAGAWSAPVRLTAHGSIPETQLMQPSDPQDIPGTSTLYHHMGTVRVPLTAFGNVADFSWVELSFGSDAVDASFIVDDLELSEPAP